MKIVISVISVILSISMVGCATFHSPKTEKYTEIDGVWYGYISPSKLGEGYYVIVSRDGVIKRIALSSYENVEDGYEQIFVDKEFKYVQPVFLRFPPSVLKGAPPWECQTIKAFNPKGYTPCSSSLTKSVTADSIGKNVVAAITTFGLMSGTTRVVDPEKVHNLVVKSNMFATIKEWEQLGKIEKVLPRSLR